MGEPDLTDTTVLLKRAKSRDKVKTSKSRSTELKRANIPWCYWDRSCRSLCMLNIVGCAINKSSFVPYIGLLEVSAIFFVKQPANEQGFWKL